MFEKLLTPEFWQHNVDYVIFGILGFMSFLMLWKVLERYSFYRRMNLYAYSNIHELNIALEENLTAIYTVGSNAPYVGLLGTVIGILLTFYEMGAAGGNVDAAKIMIGLAMALKATALGILVAIPSVIFYNALARTVEVKRESWLALGRQPAATPQ